MTESSVEAADPSDEDEIMALCRLKHDEIGIFPFCEEKVRSVVQCALKKERGVIGIIRAEGKIVACVCLMIDSLYYTSQEHLAEMFDFVHPDYRKSNYARLLIKYTKKCSDKLARPMFMGVFTTERQKAKAALYGRQLETVGMYFMHNRALAEAWKKPLDTLDEVA